MQYKIMKDYKKILEGVVNIVNTTEKSDIGFANICTYIGENCPELKESEDERIRKAIYNCVKWFGFDSCFFKDVSQEECFDWLEKQGKKTKPIEGFNTEFERQVSCLIASAMNKDYEYTKDFVKWTSEGLLNYAKREFEKNSMGISEATKQELEDNLNKALEKETPESCNEFIDEQNEQKPVEPKFHKGDWVVVSTTKGDRVVQIASVEYFKDDYPSYITTEGRWFGNGTKARLLTDKDVEIATIPESKIIVNKIKYWSEEDERMLDNAISSINHESVIEGLKSRGISYSIDSSTHLMENLIDWLNSLKDRVQPKQEWSYEDRIHLGNCIALIQRASEREANWLKSLRPQNTWKPSGEQMKVLLSEVTAWTKGCHKQIVLESLYNDLQKLK